jgi:hypothetical protein
MFALPSLHRLALPVLFSLVALGGAASAAEQPAKPLPPVIRSAQSGPWSVPASIKMEQISVHKEFSPIGKKPDEADFPKPLELLDDSPPVTVITEVRLVDGKLVVRGTAADNGTIKEVHVNDVPARSVSGNFGQWEVVLPKPQGDVVKLKVAATDEAGNVEKRPRLLTVKAKG